MRCGPFVSARSGLVLVIVLPVIASMHAQVAAPPSQTPSATYDLKNLQRSSLPAVAVTVDDPVYRESKTYRAYQLKKVLTAAFPEIAKYNGSSNLIFRCRDGYSPSMPLALALGENAFLAFRDVAAEPSKRWKPFRQGKEMITPAPFYLVWKSAPHDSDLPWPYQIEQLQILPASGDPIEMITTDAGARHGSSLFAEHCVRCHSLNLKGGYLGPELNVPRNVTEYWSSAILKEYILDAESFHSHSKMPSFRGVLTPPDIDDVVAYLTVMAAHKVCTNREECEHR